MIKRLSARRSHGTLVANPRRKRRNGKRKHARKGRRSLSALLANPKHKRKRKHANPKHKRRNPLRARRKRRNPAIGGIDFAGVNLVNVGIGSVATVALGAVGQAVFDKYLKDTIQNDTLRAMAPNLIVAGVAWAAHKYVGNQMVKEVAKVTIALSIFKAIDDSFGKQIKEGVQKMLPGTSGAYTLVPGVSGNYALSGGMYIDTTSGNFTANPGIFPGANLYGL